MRKYKYLKQLRPLGLFLCLYFYTACSNVEFSHQYSYQEGEFFVGHVDILFVVDNSGSMSSEHKHIASRFNMYIKSLDESGLDYQIAMITTDVSASPNNSQHKSGNGDGAYQDGKFLEFEEGVTILTEDHSRRVELFSRLIQRKETISCEMNNFVNDECASFDERGIYAASLAIERRDRNFFRKGTHLAIVFISDEDERSTGGEPSNHITLPEEYLTLDSKDKPEHLVETVSHLSTQKSFSVYSIVVKPGDSTCLKKQRDQGEFFSGEYGDLYASLAEPSIQLKDLGLIMDGFLGNICASNYGSQLDVMGQKVSEDSKKIQLSCKPLESSSQNQTDQNNESDQSIVDLTFYFETDKGQPYDYRGTYSIDGSNVLTFSPTLPPGIKVRYEYTCPLRNNNK